MLVWDEETARRHDSPRLFTHDQWHAFSDQQREVISLQRQAWVDALETEHLRRYHAQANLMALRMALVARDDS